MSRYLSFALVLILIPALLVAQSGKLRGVVTDRESGEALIGANILVDGTSMGGSTDINGEYVILNVPPGVYTLRASYVGYTQMTISNVRVSSNISTTQDFTMSSTAIATDVVEVIAERPLIQRNTTNTTRVSTQDEIRNIPIRGVQNILALDAGVVQKDNNLHVRGGRAGDVAFYVEGASVTNPLFNTENVTVIQEAIEEIQLQAGGYTADFGGANAGIVRTTMRTGGPDFKLSLDYQTDDFAKPGEQFLNTSAFGYRNAVATVSGAVPGVSAVRFFVAGQHNYMRQSQPMYLEPFKFEGLTTDINDARGAGVLLPDSGTIEFKRNYLYNNPNMTNTVQGNISVDFAPFKLRFSGSYTGTQNNNRAGWPGALGNYFALSRNQLQDTETLFGNVRLTHILTPTTFYEVNVSYQNRGYERYDRDFKDDWRSYMDSTKNADLGYDNFRSKYLGPNAYSTINGFGFASEDAPNNTYAKNSQSAFGANIDLTTQITTQWELKAGGKMEQWTIRNFTVGSISNYLRYLNGEDGNTPRTFASDAERRIQLAQRGTINNYGYDVDGNESDSELDAPPKPLFASAYVQNRFEFVDLVLNAGLRFEYFDKDQAVFPDPENYETTAFDAANDVIDEAKLVKEDPFMMVLPRISFSFPVTDQTVFYAQYGKYAQMPSLNRLYVSDITLSRTVSPNSRGNAYLTYVGWFMKPERSTEYEIGIRQLLTDNFALTLSGFYRDLRDQLATRQYTNANGQKLFIAFLNEDFGTTKGLELTLELRRTERLSARVHYTLSDARGSGSNPNAAQGAIEQNIGRPISVIAPFLYNQTHTGSVMLDYRFAKGDGGPILEGLGVNMLLSFNSGHSYTRIRPLQELGQSTPWTVGVYPLADPRGSFPLEPVNASTTPWVYNIDLSVNKAFYLPFGTIEVYANILNLLDSKQILNVYPTTGVAEDDGWLTNPAASGFVTDPLYVAFYRAINLDNRWAYQNTGRSQQGNDLYGTPRQIRVGIRVEI